MAMSAALKISIGQCSDKGRKEINQDFHGACMPDGAQWNSKGVAVALADGISSSEVSQIASAVAVEGFLADYYCTPDAWSVKRSAQRVLGAINAWLYAQTQQRRFGGDRGYICTFSLLVLKSSTAHIFHVGDTRIYRIVDNALEQLTEDHRVRFSDQHSYLGRALGVGAQVEVDYLSCPVETGDIFVLATDGVYEYVAPDFVVETARNPLITLDEAARRVVEEALRRGSPDNLTLQVVRIDELPAHEANEFARQLANLPPAPLLDARMLFDGYRIERELHASSRSHIYLALDGETDERVAIKTPSIDMQGDEAYLERFLIEEWVARRIDNPHVLRAGASARKRQYLYVVTEHVEGQTLAQWMIDNPKPPLETARTILEQIAKGVQAFHRLDMLHQDLRPNNIMIDAHGTVKIIDFGAVRVAGIAESSATTRDDILGTTQYTAPEYFLGEPGSPRAEIFSLGVIAYQMLSGRLPYGAEVAKIRTRRELGKLHYRSILELKIDIPGWVDEVLRRAVHPQPAKRYDDVSEFAYALRHPGPEASGTARMPLLERNPLVFWKTISAVLFIVVMALVALLYGH